MTDKTLDQKITYITVNKKKLESMKLFTADEIDSYIEKQNKIQAKAGTDIRFQTAITAARKTRDFESLLYVDEAFVDDKARSNFRDLYEKLVNFAEFKDNFTALAMIRKAKANDK